MIVLRLSGSRTLILIMEEDVVESSRHDPHEQGRSFGNTDFMELSGLFDSVTLLNFKLKKRKNDGVTFHWRTNMQAQKKEATASFDDWLCHSLAQTVYLVEAVVVVSQEVLLYGGSNFR